MKDKAAFSIVAGVSALVLLIILILKTGWITPSMDTPAWLYYFPLFNAIINGTCALLLTISYRAIKKKKIELHKKLNVTSFVLSAIFILLYVSFHLFVPETKYGGEGSMRIIYFFILASHIILAAVVLPLILISFYFGLRMEVGKHRKIVKYAFPIWLYVAITGVLVYLMISPYYQFP